MVFDNIFRSASTGAGLFSVNTDGVRPQPGADVDFEDSQEGTYDDTSTSLFTSGIHGATSRAKIVREQSPEARIVLGFLGSFIQATQESASTQADFANDPSSVSTGASARMQTASPTVTEHSGLQKNGDLQDKPTKSDYTKLPDTPEAPEPPAPPAPSRTTAETPKTLGETKTDKATGGDPPDPR
ncbi:hypothetical protein ABZY36_37105 [Streptomyces sp. NPDC006627]|uniref:hypothetical protein n=1 Tax=Streptomyces sp. NPDC006627 TaxID=3154679 RepID=UPI0033B8AC19